MRRRRRYVLDITDPAKAEVVYSKGGVWGPEGSSEEWDAKTVQDYFGGITIAWSPDGDTQDVQGELDDTEEDDDFEEL